jgi:hypothetical protein
MLSPPEIMRRFLCARSLPLRQGARCGLVQRYFSFGENTHLTVSAGDGYKNRHAAASRGAIACNREGPFV